LTWLLAFACLFLHKGLSITASVATLVLIHGDEEGMISGFAGADVETIASIMYE